ncbi:Isochorismatase family [Kingella potus]|uniref:Isochorismatase family n=1 Tax=Kingella potus TaxID=265175 RepID=A0A377R003_9NEIS|nr:isochorismatase family protein [Kingella potus]UOP00778.1 isochorismatase family protein [Kingella potus]STR00419.1 Isochorismatase family [Kingella potus]
MKPENTVCLIIDIQERLTPSLHEAEQFTAACRLLIQGVQALDIPAMFTEQYPKGLGATLPAVRLLLPDAPLAEKTRFSAAPAAESFIREKQAQNIILIGAETHICVLQTALDLRLQGMGVYLPFECAASRNPANKANGLEQMRTAGVTVCSIESLLFSLMGDAQHPAFKTISKLIR